MNKYILKFFFYIAIFVALCFFSIQICDIKPNKLYYWYSGIWHGFFVVPHFIMSIFYDGIYFMAPNSTFAYKFWWWNVFAFSTLAILGRGRKW